MPMKRFILKSFLFITPFLLCIGIEIFVLPIDYFTFRAWEALVVRKFRDLLPGPFYPNMKIEKIEEGDLAHHTQFAIKRKVDWITDRYGFRKENTPKSPEIVIVGDSNIAGGGLSQEKTISEVLEDQLKIPVYPLAPARIQTFLKTKRFKDHPPKIVILGAVERELIYLSPVKFKQRYEKESQIFKSVKDVREGRRFQTIIVFFDRIAKTNMLHAFRAHLRRMVSSKRDINPQYVHSKFGPIFFLQGAEANKEIPKERRNQVIEVVKNYHNALKSRGIRFIFLPIPEKENLFHDLLKTPRPTFLEQVIVQLKKEGIDTIDTQKAFEEAYQKEQTLLYQSDDTHWSKEGVSLAAKLIVEAIGNIE